MVLLMLSHCRRGHPMSPVQQQWEFYFVGRCVRAQVAHMAIGHNEVITWPSPAACALSGSVLSFTVEKQLFCALELHEHDIKREIHLDQLWIPTRVTPPSS